jgi:hypothetical protein
LRADTTDTNLKDANLCNTIMPDGKKGRCRE